MKVKKQNIKLIKIPSTLSFQSQMNIIQIQTKQLEARQKLEVHHILPEVFREKEQELFQMEVWDFPYMQVQAKKAKKELKI